MRRRSSMFFKNDNDRRPKPSAGRSRSSRSATSSCSRTWSCRCSSGARSRSPRSTRRWTRDKEILLAAQKNAKTNDPTPEDIFAVGTLGTIIQLLRLPDGTVKVLVEGKRRARDQAASSQTETFFLVRGRGRRRDRATQRRGRGADALGAGDLRDLRQAQQEHPARDADDVQTIDDAGAARRHDRRAPPTSSSTTARSSSRSTTPAKRLERLYELMQAEIEILAGREEDPLARQEADGEDAEGVLPQRADAGDPEGAGGERDEFKNEIQELEEKIKTKKMSEGGARARSRRS